MKVRAKTFESWIRANFSNSDLKKRGGNDNGDNIESKKVFER